MSLVRALACPLTFALVATPINASASIANPWHQVASPDGEVTFQMPCSEAQVVRQSTQGFFQASCVDENVVYAILIGIPPGNGELGTYEQNLAAAKSDVESRVEEITLAGRYPAFRATPIPGQIHYALSVDFRPATPIFMIAAEARKGGTPPSQAIDVATRCRTFIESIEIATR